MPIASPFFFAWVEPDETTFDISHHRMDEYIFSARRTIAEGEKPLLEIEIQNPHVGILSPSRKYWAWFSWFNGSAIEPLFFGRVVGSPVEIFEEVIRLQLVADPIDYKQRVQQVAETLKVPPFYDPVFIDVGQRNDPNTILEAHAKVWDVNPVTHAVTANDIIVGSDGNEDFTGDDHFYDGMQMTIGQPPATAILMDASVSWNQTARGIVDITNGYRRLGGPNAYPFGPNKFACLNGDGFISEWPKPLSDIGGGYKVYFADVLDTAGAQDAEITTITGGMEIRQKNPTDGALLTQDWSLSVPTGGTIWRESKLDFTFTAGFMDKFAVDSDGDPAPINIPMDYKDTTGYVMEWNISAALTLQYEAQRQRTERVVFQVRADTQPLLTAPELSQESETITKSGADIGVPIVNLLNWTAITGTHVDVGQIILPDNPNIPGGNSLQICTAAGTAGTVVPDFSDEPGATTTDGTVTWTSLGVATPPDNAVDWTFGSYVNAGTIISPKRPFFVSYTTLLLPGTHTFPPSAVTIAEGTYVQMTDGSFAVCTFAGIVGPQGNSAVFTDLGTSLPSGNGYFVATTAGTTGAQWVIPPFDETLHATTTDGTVVWTCIGSGEIPAGGYPGDSWRPAYFATDRGRQSLEYLAALVRAKLLYRARCIEIQFDCEYGRGVSLTTRKTATLHDPRIAGGVAFGKIKGAELSVSDTGVAGCRVTLACCAGLGNAVEEVPGDPSYVDAGYVDGYQWHDNVTTVLPTADLGYAPPVYTTSDDGLTFPLTREMIVVSDTFHVGADVSSKALESMAAAAQKQKEPPALWTLDEIYAKQREVKLLQDTSLASLLKVDPSWQEFQIKPVNGGPFNKIYNVAFSDLTVPMGIDLQSDTTA